MDFDKLFTMSNMHIRGALHVDTADDEIDGDAVFRAEESPSTPIVFRHESGGKPRDLIGTTFVSLKLISQRVIDVLKTNKFTGWTTYPVEVYGKKSVRVNGYHGFAVTGKCGKIDWSRGKRERRPAPVPNGSAYDVWIGMYFDPNSWDGTDIFSPEGTTYTIVTESVKDALLKIKATNISFTPLSDFVRTWSA